VGRDDGVGVGVGVGVSDMKDVVGLEGTLQPSGLHQLCQNRNVGKTAPTWTTTTHPSTSASFVLIVTSNTLVPLSHYPTKTSGNGRTSNTSSKLDQYSRCQIIMILLLLLLLLLLLTLLSIEEV